MAPPQSLKNFKFKPIFPLLSFASQDEVGLSTPHKALPFVNCVVVLLDDDKGKIIVVHLVGKAQDGKKKKLYKHD
jgi:hypothetical protein